MVDVVSFFLKKKKKKKTILASILDYFQGFWTYGGGDYTSPFPTFSYFRWVTNRRKSLLWLSTFNFQLSHSFLFFLTPCLSHVRSGTHFVIQVWLLMPLWNLASLLCHTKGQNLCQSQENHQKSFLLTLSTFSLSHKEEIGYHSFIFSIVKSLCTKFQLYAMVLQP